MEIDFEQLKRAFDVENLNAVISINDWHWADCAFFEDNGLSAKAYIHKAAREYLDLKPLKEYLTTEQLTKSPENVSCADLTNAADNSQNVEWIL